MKGLWRFEAFGFRALKSEGEKGLGSYGVWLLEILMLLRLWGFGY